MTHLAHLPRVSCASGVETATQLCPFRWHLWQPAIAHASEVTLELAVQLILFLSFQFPMALYLYFLCLYVASQLIN